MMVVSVFVLQAVLDEPVQGILADPDLGLDSTGHPEVVQAWTLTYTTAVKTLTSLRNPAPVSIPKQLKKLFNHRPVKIIYKLIYLTTIPISIIWEE